MGLQSRDSAEIPLLGAYEASQAQQLQSCAITVITAHMLLSLTFAIALHPAACMPPYTAAPNQNHSFCDILSTAVMI